MRQGVENVQKEKLTNTPKATSKSYEPRQKQFKKWCHQKQFVDGELASEGKLLLFLQEVVAKMHSRKKLPNGTAASLDWASFGQYVKAVVDLYQLQKQLSSNPHSHPRGDSVRSYLDSIRTKKDTAQRRLYADRGVGTMVDGYQMDEYPLIM